jgi:hypothetical protein
MKTQEQIYKQKLQEIVEWLEASKEEFRGGTIYNAHMLIESIKKLLK